MPKNDGTIKIGTEIVLDGLKRSFDKLKRDIKKNAGDAQKSLSSSLKLGKEDAKNFRQYHTALRKELKESSKDVLKLRKSFRESVTTTGYYSEATVKLKEKLDEAEAKERELKDAVDKTTRSAKKSGDAFQSSGEKIKGTAAKIGQAAGAVAVAGIGVGVGLAKMGLDYNIQMEGYTSNFKVMLGSTEAAVEKVEELKALAAKTPFGVGDLADATQTLLSFQVPAEETGDIITRLGDIALGDKEKLKGLALVFGQVSSAGKLTGQDLMQFINQGFNPLNYIAERTGESMEELRDRMSKGKVGVDEIKQAFVDATSEGGQFFNGMQEGSQTTEGLISTLKDTILGKLGEATEGISAKIKELLPEIIEYIENINVDELLSSISDAADRAKEALQIIYDKFIELSPIIAGVTGAIIGFKTAMEIAALIEGVSNAITAFKAANEGATIAQAALNFVMNLNPFVLIATLVLGVVAALVTLWVTNDEFRAKVVAAWEAVKEGIGNAIDSITEWFHNMVRMFTELPGKALSWGKDMIDGFVKGIKAKVSAVVDAVKNVAHTVASFLHFSRPDVGPLREYEEWMPDMMKGLAKGISQNAWRVDQAIAGVSGKMATSIKGASYEAAQGSGGNGNIYIYGDVSDPDVFARRIRLERQYGLAGAR